MTEHIANCGHLVENYMGVDIYFHVNSYRCPSLKLFGYAYERNIKRDIRKALKDKKV